MKHATQKTLEMINPILEQLRKSGLKEKGFGKFYKASQAYVHFHEDATGVYADVKRKGKWQRLKIPRNKKECKRFAHKLMK